MNADAEFNAIHRLITKCISMTIADTSCLCRKL